MGKRAAAGDDVAPPPRSESDRVAEEAAILRNMRDVRATRTRINDSVADGKLGSVEANRLLGFADELLAGYARQYQALQQECEDAEADDDEVEIVQPATLAVTLALFDERPPRWKRALREGRWKPSYMSYIRGVNAADYVDRYFDLSALHEPHKYRLRLREEYAELAAYCQTNK